MNLCPAQPFDIDSIMKIERASFIPGIQEKQSVFEERIRVFSNGFLLLTDNSEKAVKEYGHGVIAGYFCSEIWDYIPGEDSFFTLGHSAGKVHNDNGKVLYASSFALLPQYRGNGNGRALFENSLKILSTSFPQLETVLLLVNEEWTGAQKIYQSLGFKELRRIPEFFASLTKKSSDGILMTAPADLFRQP